MKCVPANQRQNELADFLQEIEEHYGQAERVWVMDRGIPTEKVLEQMRAPNAGSNTWWARRGRLSQYDKTGWVALAGGAGRCVGQTLGRGPGIVCAGKARQGEQGHSFIRFFSVVVRSKETASVRSKVE